MTKEEFYNLMLEHKEAARKFHDILGHELSDDREISQYFVELGNNLRKAVLAMESLEKLLRVKE